MTSHELPDQTSGYASVGSPAVAGSLPGAPVNWGRGAGAPGTVTGREAIAAAMSEAELERRVRKLMKDLGLLSYHAFRSDKSEKGFPDWTIVGGRTIFRELKRQSEGPAPAQRKWLMALTASGEDADVWRPMDLLSGRVAKELAAISKLGRRAA